MLGSDVLDVGLGLVLVFLMMSIIMTAVQEAIEGVLRTRATHLENALKELLHAHQDKKGEGQEGTDVLDSFYRHPLIYALYKGSNAKGKGEGPTYIPREAFSAAIIDLVDKGEVTLPPGLQRAYDGLKKVAGGDAKRLRRELEGWYDAAMDRASGWFKRSTQWNLFCVGLAAAIVLNINALSIAQFLHANKAQRERLVNLADRTAPPARAGKADAQAAAPPEAEAMEAGDQNATAALPYETAPGNGAAPATADPQASLPDGKDTRAKGYAGLNREEFQQELYDSGLPFGWNAAARTWTLREFAIADAKDKGAKWVFGYIAALIGLAVGYLITALATTLGAPFWFDVLNRLMVIRSTVKPKEKSPDEPSQDGGTDKNAPESKR